MFYRQRRSRLIGAMLWLITRPGWLLVWALFTASDLGDRLNQHLGDWSWRDVVGSLLLFPISVLIAVAAFVGFRDLARLTGWSP